MCHLVSSRSLSLFLLLSFYAVGFVQEIFSPDEKLLLRLSFELVEKELGWLARSLLYLLLLFQIPFILPLSFGIFLLQIILLDFILDNFISLFYVFACTLFHTHTNPGCPRVAPFVRSLVRAFVCLFLVCTCCVINGECRCRVYAFFYLFFILFVNLF